jgi:hypothetical protein
VGFHRFLRRTKTVVRTLHGFVGGQKSVCRGRVAASRAAAAS